MTLFILAIASAAVAGCEFKTGRDYSDPAGPVLNASSPEDCCSQCLKRPACVAAVFGNWSGGQCYTKLDAKHPIERGAGAGIVGCVTGRAAIKDKFYDCPFRHLALNFTRTAILSQWTSPTRIAEALAAVSNGLRIDQCPDNLYSQEAASSDDEEDPNVNKRSSPAHASATRNKKVRRAAASARIQLFVSPTGDDSASGTRQDPLQTIKGAQSVIRSRWPTVAKRPAIRVILTRGDYFLPRRAPTTSKSQHTASVSPRHATFTSADSGSFSTSPITYTADIDPVTGEPVNAVLHGGMLLSGEGPAGRLEWRRASEAGGKAFRAEIPETISINPQDQLFLGDIMLVRARIPNGRPWLAMDGFNLTASNCSSSSANKDLPSWCDPIPNQPRQIPACGFARPVMPKPFPGHPNGPPLPALGSCSELVNKTSLL